MHLKVYSLLVATLLGSAGSVSAEEPAELKARAEAFFRGVYGGDATVVDKLASDRVVISYPIFQKVYKKAAMRGSDDVKKFIVGFGKKWTDSKVTIHESLVDGNRVVLVWSFEARFVNPDQQGQTVSEPRRWGGISLFRFDDDGRIEQELGEESEPGPFGRLLTDQQ